MPSTRFFCVLCGAPRDRAGCKLMFVVGRRRWVCVKHEKPKLS